jgi:hypothetical protein
MDLTNGYRQGGRVIIAVGRGTAGGRWALTWPAAGAAKTFNRGPETTVYWPAHVPAATARLWHQLGGAYD